MSDLTLASPAPFKPVTTESPGIRLLLIAIVGLFLAGFLFLPLVVVFVEAFRHGIGALVEALAEPDALAAIRLTLLVAAIAVPFNLIVGVAAAWAIGKFEFKGKNVLLTLIEIGRASCR